MAVSKGMVCTSAGYGRQGSHGGYGGRKWRACLSEVGAGLVGGALAAGATLHVACTIRSQLVSVVESAALTRPGLGYYVCTFRRASFFSSAPSTILRGSFQFIFFFSTNNLLPFRHC